MTRKYIFIGVLLSLIIMAGNVIAEDWLDNIENAKQIAKKNNRYILVNFSGSDWCGWCIKLSNEVFSKPVFQDYAKKNLVLFVADFPRFKKIPPETESQNNRLQREFGVAGFPTVYLLNPQGEIVAKTGYRPGGAEAYVKHIQDLIEESIKNEN